MESTINILLYLLYHIFISPFIYSFIHLIFEWFQSKLQTPAYMSLWSNSSFSLYLCIKQIFVHSCSINWNFFNFLLLKVSFLWIFIKKCSSSSIYLGLGLLHQKVSECSTVLDNTKLFLEVVLPTYTINVEEF